MKETFYHTLSRDGEDIELEIKVDVFSRGAEATMPSWNHPGDPPEAPEFEITSISPSLTLTPEEEQEVNESICEEIWENRYDGDYYDDYYD